MNKKTAITIGLLKGIGVVLLILAFVFKGENKPLSLTFAFLGFFTYVSSMIMMFIARRKMKAEREAKAASEEQV